MKKNTSGSEELEEEKGKSDGETWVLKAKHDSYKLVFHHLQIETWKLEFYLGIRVLDTWDASFQHCFETWQLTKFFDI